MFLFSHLWGVRPTKSEPLGTVCSWIRKHWYQPNTCLGCSQLWSEKAPIFLLQKHSRNRFLAQILPCYRILCPRSFDVSLPLESSLLVLTVSLSKSLHSPYPSCLSLLLSIDKAMLTSDRTQLIDSLPASFSSKHFCSIRPYEFPMDSGKGSEYITKLDAFEDLSSASSLAFPLKGCQRQRSSDTVLIKNSSFLLLFPPIFFLHHMQVVLMWCFYLSRSGCEACETGAVTLYSPRIQGS